MAAFLKEDLDFLQTRARIWVEGVIHHPLPANETLSTALADGQVLSEVATNLEKLIRKPVENGDGSGSSHGSHTPSKVASSWSCLAKVEKFLKMCKDIGVPSLDLFSPMDVVQEKDIKRVCLCFRALAKKAKALNPQVPSFDDTSSLPVQIRSKGLVETAKKDLKANGLSEKTINVDVDVSIGKVTIPLELLEEEANFGKFRGLQAANKSPAGDKSVRYRRVSSVPKAPFNDEKTRRGPLWAVMAFGAACVVGTALLLVSKHRRYETYRIKQGDTLYDISKKVMMKDWRAIHEKNPHLRDPDLIFPEQTIRLQR